MKWKTPEPREYYAKYKHIETANSHNWFECYELPGDVIAICEPQHLQEVNAFLIFGEKKALQMAHYASRDNARTPVQWSAEKNAGFTAGKPWFKVNPNYVEVNVADQEKDPESLLNFYREAIRLRRSLPSRGARHPRR